MKCEEYKQQIAADPSYDGGASHLLDCADCRAYRQDMLALDQRIRKALTVAVPDAPDILVDNVTPLRPPRRRQSGWLAVAACALLAVALGFVWLNHSVEYDTLADEIVAHLDHEPASLRMDNPPVSNARLARVVPANVASMDNEQQLITYARSCVINGKKVPHLVLKGERGPITVLLLPEEEISTAVDLGGDHINGVLLPVGNGSIAIIGDREEQLDRVENEIRNSVTWET